jgi:glucokinase
VSHVLALDLGGTSIKAEVFPSWAAGSHAGPPAAQSAGHRATPRGGAAAVLHEVVDLAREVLGSLSDDIEVGVAVPGLVDAPAGIGRYSANLDWRDAPVAAVVGRELGLPVTLVHDIAAAGVAEHQCGAGRDVDDLAVVVIGTGVAAALFVGGRPVTGGAGQAGELGHVVARPGGPACACGRSGCLEAVASAAAIARRYAELSGKPVSGALDVQQRLGADADADLVWSEAVTALAQGLLVLAGVLAPSRIVVGGGLAECGDALLVPLRRSMRQQASVEPLPEIVPAAHGVRAGLVGAALAARDPALVRSVRLFP